MSQQNDSDVKHLSSPSTFYMDDIYVNQRSYKMNSIMLPILTIISSHVFCKILSPRDLDRILSFDIIGHGVCNTSGYSSIVVNAIFSPSVVEKVDKLILKRKRQAKEDSVENEDVISCDFLDLADLDVDLKTSPNSSSAQGYEGSITANHCIMAQLSQQSGIELSELPYVMTKEEKSVLEFQKASKAQKRKKLSHDHELRIKPTLRDTKHSSQPTELDDETTGIVDSYCDDLSPSTFPLSLSKLGLSSLALTFSIVISANFDPIAVYILPICLPSLNNTTTQLTKDQENPHSSPSDPIFPSKVSFGHSLMNVLLTPSHLVLVLGDGSCLCSYSPPNFQHGSPTQGHIAPKILLLHPPRSTTCMLAAACGCEDKKKRGASVVCVDVNGTVSKWSVISESQFTCSFTHVHKYAQLSASLDSITSVGSVSHPYPSYIIGKESGAIVGVVVGSDLAPTSYLPPFEHSHLPKIDYIKSLPECPGSFIVVQHCGSVGLYSHGCCEPLWFRVCSIQPDMPPQDSPTSSTSHQRRGLTTANGCGITSGGIHCGSVGLYSHGCCEPLWFRVCSIQPDMPPQASPTSSTSHQRRGLTTANGCGITSGGIVCVGSDAGKILLVQFIVNKGDALIRTKVLSEFIFETFWVVGNIIVGKCDDGNIIQMRIDGRSIFDGSEIVSTMEEFKWF
ncbi:hypothetical protein ADUPG1_009479 [Aduncisulcus paluster]|uniref:Uncharacterized protein n=1 Tax=Aduncisulcus paluster TaxID=2918883 RepID=A0ABQ5KVQ0_9EUKA|nr:hypothetical protein ADUPG1_009479 [Aduncisulcus paluster]